MLGECADFISAPSGRAAERRPDYFKTRQDESVRSMYKISETCHAESYSAHSPTPERLGILEEHASKTNRSIGRINLSVNACDSKFKKKFSRLLSPDSRWVRSGLYVTTKSTVLFCNEL
jgi:hypothetical protein